MKTTSFVPNHQSLTGPRPYSSEETRVHRTFARRCIRANRFEELSSRYLAMKDECQRIGLRHCSFTEFRNAVRLSRRKFVLPHDNVGGPSRPSALRLRGNTAVDVMREITGSANILREW
ncbi:hypothetical protein ACU8NW_16890 [Rhizobium leguminosarum]